MNSSYMNIEEEEVPYISGGGLYKKRKSRKRSLLAKMRPRDPITKRFIKVSKKKKSKKGKKRSHSRRH